MSVHRSLRRRKIVTYVLFIVPAMTLFLIFFVYPVIGTFQLSLYKWEGIGPKIFIGLKNFVFILKHKKFLMSLVNTFVIAIVVTTVLNTLSLSTALLLSGYRKQTELFRALIFMPVVISRVASAVIFAALLDPSMGFVNFVLRTIGLPGLAIPWMGTPVVSLLVISWIIIWGGIGITMTIYIAGLKGISVELLESAEIDGAGRMVKFRYVTFPLLAPALTVNIALVFISCLKVFEEPWLIYRMGPPKISSVVSTVIVWEAFSGSQFGFASSVSVVLFLITMLLGFLQISLLRRRERYMQ